MTRAGNRAERGLVASAFSRGALGLLLVQAAIVVTAPRAHAQDLSAEQDACIQSYENAQEHRLKGALQAAAAELASCSQPICPAFIRTDCAAWSNAVAADLPSMLFSITSGGRALEEVKISIDDARIAEYVPSQPLTVDPGNHVFRFVAAGTETVRESVFVERGQKARAVQIELRPLVRKRAILPKASSVALPAPLRVEDPLRAPAFDARSLALGVIGVGGVAGFAVLGLHARSEETKLRGDCAPYCSAADISSVRSQYLMADVSLGIGLTALAFGAYLFVSSRAPKLATGARPPLGIVVDRGTASASFSGAF
jgi:hypothetical protein